MTTLNVSGPSNLQDVSAQNMDLSGTLNVRGTLNVSSLVNTTEDKNIGGTKTFTNTINGNISGNAETVTNGIYTTGGQTINGTTTLDTISINGNILSQKFRTIKPVNELSNVFPSSSTATTVTIATNVKVNGGTLTSHIQVGGYKAVSGYSTYTVRYRIDSITRNITISFDFNIIDTHQVLEITDVQTGIPSGSLKIDLLRSTTDLRCDVDDFINITIQEKPY